jgi:glutamate/tyrosine decarboxylase-like PLP-dependent enzyme
MNKLPNALKPLVPKHLREVDWKKIPSITNGGKKYFYFKPGVGWVVWNRMKETWVFESI